MLACSQILQSLVARVVCKADIDRPDHRVTWFDRFSSFLALGSTQGLFLLKSFLFLPYSTRPSSFDPACSTWMPACSGTAPSMMLLAPSLGHPKPCRGVPSIPIPLLQGRSSPRGSFFSRLGMGDLGWTSIWDPFRVPNKHVATARAAPSFASDRRLRSYTTWPRRG